MASSNNDVHYSKKIQIIVVWFALVLWAIYFVFLISALALDTALKPFFKDHMGAAVAIPLAGISSFLLVVILEIKSGPVRFEGLGFKLEGAAGPVLFWVICFLAIVLGMRMVP